MSTAALSCKRYRLFFFFTAKAHLCENSILHGFNPKMIVFICYQCFDSFTFPSGAFPSLFHLMAIRRWIDFNCTTMYFEFSDKNARTLYVSLLNKVSNRGFTKLKGYGGGFVWKTSLKHVFKYISTFVKFQTPEFIQCEFWIFICKVFKYFRSN